MNEQPITKGAIVQLKSGGPKMTVDRESLRSRMGSDATEMVCSWFDGSKKMEQAFSIASLRLADPEE